MHRDMVNDRSAHSGLTGESAGVHAVMVSRPVEVWILMGFVEGKHA